MSGIELSRSVISKAAAGTIPSFIKWPSSWAGRNTPLEDSRDAGVEIK
ncbi:MAG: hypothetical protein OET44_00175 [Gammaproteobacteria bacterium]|nr:hypothetical protein [Gammaproteobacteria bacterium]